MFSLLKKRERSLIRDELLEKRVKEGNSYEAYLFIRNALRAIISGEIKIGSISRKSFHQVDNEKYQLILYFHSNQFHILAEDKTIKPKAPVYNRTQKKILDIIVFKKTGKALCEVNEKKGDAWEKSSIENFSVITEIKNLTKHLAKKF